MIGGSLSHLCLLSQITYSAFQDHAGPQCRNTALAPPPGFDLGPGVRRRPSAGEDAAARRQSPRCCSRDECGSRPRAGALSTQGEPRACEARYWGQTAEALTVAPHCHDVQLAGAGTTG